MSAINQLREVLNTPAVGKTSEKVDSLAFEAIQEWFDSVKDMDTIVISVGSAFSEKQQNPRFAQYLNKTAVLNIDDDSQAKATEERDLFSMKTRKTSAEGIDIEYLPIILSQKEAPKSYQGLRTAISKCIASGKKVVFACHTWPC